MESIDVTDLPEPVARALETVVQAVRQQLHKPGPQSKTLDLPRWEGEVIGSLSREEIYDGAV